MDATPQDLDAIANADPNFGAAQCSSGMEHSGADTQIDPEFSQPPASNLDPGFLRPSILPDGEYDQGFNQFPLPDDLTVELEQSTRPDTFIIYQLLTRLPWLIAQPLCHAILATHEMRSTAIRAPDLQKAASLLAVAQRYYALAKELYDYHKHPWLFSSCSAGYVIKGTDIGFSFEPGHEEYFINERAVRKAFIDNYECVAALMDSNGELPTGGHITMCGFVGFGKWIDDTLASLLTPSEDNNWSTDENIPERN